MPPTGVSTSAATSAFHPCRSAEQLAGEDPRLVATRCGAHLYKDIAPIIWVGLEQEAWEAFEDLALDRLALGALSDREGAHLCVGIRVRLKRAGVDNALARSGKSLASLSNRRCSCKLAADAREDGVVGE